MTPPWSVLVVDDVEGLRRLVTLVLEKEDDYEIVGEADDGDSALDVVQREGPDLVLLDLSMPGMDGFEVLGRIREQADDIEVIVLSGHEDSTTKEKALDEGAIGFIEKGASPHELVGQLDEILAGSTR